MAPEQRGVSERRRTVSPLTQRTTQPGAAELAGQVSAPAPRRALCAYACPPGRTDESYRDSLPRRVKFASRGAEIITMSRSTAPLVLTLVQAF